MNYNFNWSVLWSGQSGGWLLQGVITTLQIFVFGLALAVILGILSGALRTAPLAPLRWLAGGYVEFERRVCLAYANASVLSIYVKYRAGCGSVLNLKGIGCIGGVTENRLSGRTDDQ